MTFLRPDLAPWALVAPAVVACWTIRRRLRARFDRRFPIDERFRPLSKRSSGARQLAALAAGVTAAGAIAIAILRPQAAIRYQVPEYERDDLVIMLDRSASMNAHDILPSRSARATEELRNFVRRKPAGIDRLALVGFADAAVVLSYLTDDVDSVLFYFDWIDADPTPLLGTNIGAALASAMEVARKDDRPTRKLFLLVSDGEDYGSELTRAVATARSRGYQIDCIGIGGDQRAPVPVRTAAGLETPLRDDAGQPVTTAFAETTLRAIAEETGGFYVRSSTGDDLRPALEAIANRQRRFVGWRTATNRRDLYPVFLGIAAFAGAMLWVLR
jgi:Ca-activated chloride channel family protein